MSLINFSFAVYLFLIKPEMISLSFSCDSGPSFLADSMNFLSSLMSSPIYVTLLTTSLVFIILLTFQPRATASRMVILLPSLALTGAFILLA